MRFVGKDPYFPREIVLERKQISKRSIKLCAGRGEHTC
jgi:hypothetical protein